MLFLGFISGKRIRFPGEWAKTQKKSGSLTSTQSKFHNLGGDASYHTSHVSCTTSLKQLNVSIHLLICRTCINLPPRPGGAARGGARGIFSRYLDLFSKYLKKRPIHIFLIDTFHFFQITIIYRGMQVTSTCC